VTGIPNLQLRLGREMKALRRSKQRSQARLAYELGVSRNTISRWETGVLCPNLWEFARFLEFLGGNPGPDYFDELRLAREQ
jgi:DNA-binding XRE family transcriptional regulator